MDIFVLPEAVTKIADLLSKLSEAGQKRRVRAILTKLLKVYVKLGDVSDSADDIVNHLRLFENFHPNVLPSQCEILKHQLSKELIYLDDALSALRELFFTIVFLDKRPDDEYWKLLESHGLESQTWIAHVMHSTIDTGEIAKLSGNEKKRLPILEFPLAKKRADNHYTIQKVDLNDKDFVTKLNKVLDKYASRPSIALIRDGRKKIKEIILQYWSSAEILDALSSLKREHPHESPIVTKRGYR